MEKSLQEIERWYTDADRMVKCLDNAYPIICPQSCTSASVLFTITVALVGKFKELRDLLDSVRWQTGGGLASLIESEEERDDELLKEAPTVRLVRP